MVIIYDWGVIFILILICTGELAVGLRSGGQMSRGGVHEE